LLIAVTIVFPSLTPANMLTALGLGSVAIGFAFKDVFENFFAGIMIMLRRPMRMGDYIECESVDGKVEHIALRETYIRKTNDELVLVPNSYLFMNPLFVHTDRELRRYEIVVGVAYGENLNAAQQVIESSLQGLDGVNYDQSPEVYAREFNSSSMDFTVRWWAGSKPIDMHRSRHQVVTAIKMALDEAGIEIPFPYRTLTFKEPLQIDDEREPAD
jgi:small conductance mechanosensitive channel